MRAVASEVLAGLALSSSSEALAVLASVGVAVAGRGVAAWALKAARTIWAVERWMEARRVWRKVRRWWAVSWPVPPLARSEV